MPHCRKCVICGKQFRCPPSAKTVTCSPQCRSERAKKAATGQKRKWNDQSKEKLSAQGKTKNLELGTQAAKNSPNAGRFDTNINAQYWVVRSPDGIVYQFSNLQNWAREHAFLFDMENNDLNGGRIASGIKQIKRSELGKNKNTVSSYKGWVLLAWDEKNPRRS